ncbi:hypothetical protein LB577_19280 [Mesorhizobium sp. B283B1A]|uniref:hypothetical protein n=1 Tax=Mesorhizobium TaxID=68287 RepID=UPI001CD0FB7A|nr:MULTISPECIES: hypothetical protein [Mesorhizobium]MCA0049065.1 hypothetical protein [Mesorhizobium sp. B283B1A]UQS62699.1 hypothetical protein M5D98_21370 [Mesorhizobium opportunistum]
MAGKVGLTSHVTRNFPAGGTVPNSHIGHQGHDTLRVTIKGRDGIIACMNRDDLEPCLNEGLLDVQQDEALILHNQDCT